MKDRDFVWCLVHEILDREEAMEGLCPECWQQAEEKVCPGCGKATGDWGEGADNPNFDRERFLAMKEGGGA